VLGPALTDQEWLNTDGSYEGIMDVVRTGVAEPVQFQAPMPPMGGIQLSDEQIRQVAAYVYSLSHGG
jgi:mono/diheme cytochrome c family protein